MSRIAPDTQSDWERHLSAILPLYGHRNWIVVADSAYPAQSRPGIETIVADAVQTVCVQKVLDAITASRHVRANVYVDAELGFVEENDAPGIAEYRRQLDAALYGFHVNRVPHEQIIHKLDQAAQFFRILIVKTEMTIPYTSVFFELDCDYWDAGAEERLRQAMAVAQTK
jgi:L-fucose mutarotase/ribose pyranase (RbsD/FucU family)